MPVSRPARRDGHGGKTVAISDCEPDISALESLLVDKAKKVMVKLSPMLDMSLALNELKTVRSVHIVAVNNECKELLLILQKEAVSSEISIHCEHIAGNGESQHYTFTLKQEKASACPLTGQVGTYLYEPNVAILKAGAFVLSHKPILWRNFTSTAIYIPLFLWFRISGTSFPG